MSITDRLKISQADIHSLQFLLGVVLRDNLAHHDRSVKVRHRKTASSALNSHHCCWSYYSNTTVCPLDKNTTELCFYIIGIHTKISCVSRFSVAFNQVAVSASLTSSRQSAWLRIDGFGWHLIFGASTKICWETPNLVKIWPLYKKTQVCIKLTAVRNILQLKNSAKGTHCCTSMATMNTLICGNKMPTRCNRGFYCRSYCLLNMFRASLCPSSGAQAYYTVVAACGISCCGFQVAGLVWSWGLCVRFAGSWAPDDGHSGARNMLSKQ